MDKTIIDPKKVYEETRFRTPSELERRYGLWVDRIGNGRSRKIQLDRLRILGQYAAIAVTGGRGRLVTSSRGEWEVLPGDVIFQFPREPIAYSPDREWFSRWIVWNGPEADLSLTSKLTVSPVLRQAEGMLLRAWLALARCMEQEEFSGVLERKAILLNLMAELIRKERNDSTPKKALYAIEMVIAYIQRDPGKHFSLLELAEMCSISEPHFRRLFRRYTGRAPLEFITLQRISKAKELLIRGESIKAVGYAVGYKDPFYFMRVFKKNTGESIGSFIRNQENVVR